MKFSKPLLVSKLKATGIHLLMSLAIFAYLAYQIVYIWYPEPYFSVDGGLQGIRLVAAVDLVLGPVITFLIFDLSKRRREIIFDLAIIITIQFAALAYGVHTTYTQRPIARSASLVGDVPDGLRWSTRTRPVAHAVGLRAGRHRFGW